MIAKRPLTSLLTRGVQSASRTPVSASAPILASSRAFSSRYLFPQTARWAPLQGQALKSRQQYPSQTVRWSSNGKDSFRQWGFEDINAALPSTSPTSPPASPQKSLILVDVREPAELTATGVIPSAVCVPLASQPDALFLMPDEFETRFGFPKPGESEGQEFGEIVFYCKAGVRARAAAQLAVKAGYDPARVGVYGGSWLDWAEKGGKVAKWEGEGYE